MQISEFQQNDFLGMAAEAGHKAKVAVNAKKYDEAWALYHQQKIFFMQHANACRFTVHQILALDSQVHEKLAEILRIENKNHEALVHIIYWAVANNDRPIKRHQDKLSTYFRRCKFKKTTIDEAVLFISTNLSENIFLIAQSKVSEWLAKENNI